APGVSFGTGVLVEAVLTFFLLLAVFGTAVDPRAPKIGGFGIGLTVAFDILMGGALTGASMNPARTFGPDLASGTFTDYWVYVAGPLVGAAVAVGFAYVLRGPGGGRAGSGAGQGALYTEVQRPGDA
ncbi:MAG: aquaporin, partial [Gaiellaceae bacterium]